MLESYLYYTGSTERETPYYLGNPLSFYQTSVVKLPEDWWIEPYSKRISGDGFVYENEIEFASRIATITHTYDLTKKWLSPGKVVNFIKKQDKIMEELSYLITYDNMTIGKDK